MKYTEKDFGLPITLLLFFIKVTFGNELPQCPEGMSYMPSEMGLQCVPQMSQNMGGYGGMNMMAPMMPANQMGSEMASYPQQMMFQQPQQMSQMAMQMPAMPVQSLSPESMPPPPMSQMVAPMSKGPVISVSYENNGEHAEAEENVPRYSDKHVDKPWKSKTRERKRTSRPRSKTTPKSKSRTTTTLKPQVKRKQKKGKAHPKALDIEIDYTDRELSLVTEQPDSLPADSTEKVNADAGEEKQPSSSKKGKRLGSKHKTSKKEFLTAVLSYISSDGRTVYRKKLSDKEAKLMLAATRESKNVTNKTSAEEKKDGGSKEVDSQEREKKSKKDNNEQINSSAGTNSEVKTALFKKKKQWQ